MSDEHDVTNTGEIDGGSDATSVRDTPESAVPLPKCKIEFSVGDVEVGTSAVEELGPDDQPWGSMHAGLSVFVQWDRITVVDDSEHVVEITQQDRLLVAESEVPVIKEISGLDLRMAISGPRAVVTPEGAHGPENEEEFAKGAIGEQTGSDEMTEAPDPNE